MSAKILCGNTFMGRASLQL